MSEPGAESLEAYHNPPTYVPQDSVPTNVFKRMLQDNLGFTTAQIWILVDDGYDTKDTVLYWKFIEI